MLKTVIAGQCSYRAYTPSDEGEVLSLLESALGPGPTGKRDSLLWRWKHFENPFGDSLLRVACAANGKVVGLRAFLRWQFEANGRGVNAVRAVDTATHPDYRRLGVFRTLTSQLAEEIQENGLDLVFNTPNKYSLSGYLKLGWQYVGTLHPLIKIINKPRFLVGLVRSRLGRKLRLRYSSEQFFKLEPPSLRSLITHPGIGELVDRDKELHERSRFTTACSVGYLEWRYLKHPGANYYALMQEEGRALAAATIFRTSSRLGLREIMLNELLTRDLDSDQVCQLLKELENSLKADYLIAMFQPWTSKYRLLRKCGFWPIPWYGMHFVVRVLNPRLPYNPCELRSWALSLGDLEFF